MGLAFGIIIDAILLWFLLLVVGKIDVSKNFMRPLAVVMAAAVASIVIRMLFLFFLPHEAIVVGYWLSFVAFFAVFYFVMSYFFDLETRAKLIIMGAVLAFHVILMFVF